MKILISGSSGLVGQTLIPLLHAKGHQVTRLIREKKSGSDIFWNPTGNEIEAEKCEGFDAVINLAGESIASGRWTAGRKEHIRTSRVEGTHLLARTIKKLNAPPSVFISASAIGYYGDRGEELLTETSSPGSLFLSEVCREWEQANQTVDPQKTRAAQVRFGIILSPNGGALAKMLLPFKMGVGGIIGSGQQYMSWISLPDVTEAILHVLTTNSIHGPVNVVAPHPISNKEFTHLLGHALHRPTLFPMPAFAARLAFGQMADELLLASTRVSPAILTKTGFKFQHPTLAEALHALLPR
jgi:uncharacterized protein